MEESEIENTFKHKFKVALCYLRPWKSSFKIDGIEYWWYP